MDHESLEKIYNVNLKICFGDPKQCFGQNLFRECSVLQDVCLFACRCPSVSDTEDIFRA